MNNKTTVHEHPEVSDMQNICDISPNAEGAREICDKINKENAKQSKAKAKRLKKDKELDKALKETFPASDPITDY